MDADQQTNSYQLPPLPPKGSIPDAGALPPGSRLPYAANPLFTGRESELHTLADQLLYTDNGRPIIISTGIGGIGKTQLAAEFVHRYGRYFPGGVFWISLAEAADVRVEIANSGRGKGLSTVYDELKLAQQVDLVQRAWLEPTQRLLVFDNCDDGTHSRATEALKRWRPTSGGCRLLVTSRRHHWPKTMGVQSLPIRQLPRTQSVQLLNKFTADHIDPTHLNAIANELGDLPLALHLAGSFLATYDADITPEAFLAQLRDPKLLDHPAMQGRGAEASPTEHDQQILRMFSLSFNSLDVEGKIDMLAHDLMLRAACFAPGEPIPRDLLLATLKQNENTVSDYTELDAADALRRLTNLGLLLRETEGDLRLHRLPARFILEYAAPPEWLAEAQNNVERTVIGRAKKDNHAGYPAALQAWEKHLHFVTNTALLRNDEQALILANELAHYLEINGEYATACHFYEHILAVSEKTLGKKHPAISTKLNNAALVYESMGDFRKAYQFYKRAILIREKTHAPNYPDIAVFHNNLAELSRNMGDYITALHHYKRAINISKQSLGSNHPQTVSFHGNLANLYHNMGNFTSAHTIYKRALAMSESIYGLDHPKTATFLNNLGENYRKWGKNALAYPIHKRALEIREHSLGSYHPHTATSLNNLALVLEKSEDYDKAFSYHKRALSIREKSFGLHHLDTAASLNNLATLHRAMGDYAAARPLFERALAICEQSLGTDHPTTKIVRNNLASLGNKK